MYPKRHYNKWTVNELLQLQREYELLNLSIPDIAKNHQRTEDSILYRLQEEELILNESVNIVPVSKNRNNRQEKTTTIMNTNKNDNSLLSQRVINLESSVSEMKTMVKQMVDEFMEQKRQKTVNRKPLRRIQTPNVFV